MKNILVLIAAGVMMIGCAHAVDNPVTPSGNPVMSDSASDAWEGPYRLWGEWTFYIDESHTQIDVVPRRYGRFHLNALKFLEEYCTNCVSIESLKNNGDGTIDLTVSITHPFPGMPEYTGFDVKGIIMFEGSHELINSYFTQDLPLYPLWPDNYRVSWRIMGDPELLNADGYVYRWSPSYDSGSNIPIFNYREGKYSSGTPTANINGYKNYYSNVNRHMFETDKKVSSTYHIWLPLGPVTVGYAVEACWEPPINTPVTNPAEDFPISANQPEAYHFNVVINDGNTITDPECCNTFSPGTVHEARSEREIWYIPSEYDQKESWAVAAWTNEFDYHSFGYWNDECDGSSTSRCMGSKWFVYEPDGLYQLIAIQYHIFIPDPYVPIPFCSIDIFEVEIDLE